jgi:hypothetical protein
MAYRLVLVAVLATALLSLSACQIWFGGDDTQDRPQSTAPATTLGGTSGGSAGGDGSGEEADSGGAVTVIVEYVGDGETIGASNPIQVEAEDAYGATIDYALETAKGTAALRNVPDGEYAITVYIDVNGDGAPSATAEPSLTIADITIGEDSVESLHFVLDDLGAPLTVKNYVTYSGDSVVGPTSPIIVRLDDWLGDIHTVRLHAARGAAILGSVSKPVYSAEYFVDLNDNDFAEAGEPGVFPPGGVQYGDKSGIVIEQIDIVD